MMMISMNQNTTANKIFISEQKLKFLVTDL